MREAVKAAIIRARTLEHFHVQFSLMFFDEITEEVMSFGDKWSDKRAKIPARLMRGAAHSGGTNISAGLIHGRTAMDIQRKNTSK